MKKLILMLSVMMLMLYPIAYSQDTILPPDETVMVVEPVAGVPTTTVETTGAFYNIDDHFLSFAAFVAIIPFVTEAVKAFITTTGFMTQALSWLISLLLALGAWFLNIPGIFESLLWWQVIIVGLAAGVASNSLFDTGLIASILKLFGIPKLT